MKAIYHHFPVVLVITLHKLVYLLSPRMRFSSYLTVLYYPVVLVKCVFKDGAYFCYYAYVLRISRYSAFLWVVPTNTGIFLCILKLCRESRT